MYKEKKRWVFFRLPFTFTTYTISDEYITINSGLFRRRENDTYLYKVVDVQLEQSILERIFGLGTVHCYSGDVTDPDLKLLHIKHAKEIKNYILEQSENERLKRKTINTQNIGGHPVHTDFHDLDGDGHPDY